MPHTREIIIALIAVFISAQNAEADQGGLDISARFTVSSEAHSYAFRYIHSNKLIFEGGKLYATYLENDLDAKIRTLDTVTGEWVEAGKLGSNGDDHGGAALAIDSEGYLHAVFGGHGRSQFRYVRSAFPYSSSQWDNVSSLGIHPTYPSLVVDDNAIVHLTYRTGVRNSSEDGRLYYRFKKPNEGWSQPRQIAYLQGQPTYTHFHHSMALSANDELFVLVNFYVDHALSHVGKRSRHVAIIKRRLSDEGNVWLTIDDKPIAGHEGIHPNTKPSALVHHVRTTSGIQLVPSGLAIDKHGNPWFVIKSSPYPNGVDPVSRETKQHLYTHDGKRWMDPIDLDEVIPPGIRLGSQILSVSVDEDDRLYLAGAINGGVGILQGKIVNGAVGQLSFTEIEARTRKDYLGITLERPSGQDSIGVPWLGYGWCFSDGLPDCHAEVIEIGR